MHSDDVRSSLGWVHQFRIKHLSAMRDVFFVGHKMKDVEVSSPHVSVANGGHQFRIKHLSAMKSIFSIAIKTRFGVNI